MPAIAEKPITKTRYKPHAATVYAIFSGKVTKDDYDKVIDLITDTFPNGKKSQYEAYSKRNLIRRMIVSEDMASAVRGLFASRQPERYKPSEPVKPKVLPTFKEWNALELVADFILAGDHARGLALRRKADDDEADLSKLEYPPLSTAARHVLERQYIGFPLTIGERRKVKTCDICGCEFIDPTKNLSAKRCEKACRDEWDRRRKRREYNDDVHDIQEERYKRDWQRQQLEYPFYSPKELRELKSHGEIVVSEDNFMSGKLAKRYYDTVDGEQSPHDFGGRKAVKHKGLTDLEGSKKYENYRMRHDPRGHDRKAYNIWWGKVKPYKLSDVTPEYLEDSKFVESRDIINVYRSFRGGEKCL